MSRKSSRITERFDYKVYSEKGRKIPKESRDLERVRKGFESFAKMVSQELIDSEEKLNFKFSRLIEEYELDLLFDISEIEAGISEIREAVDKYEDIQVELKRELGERYNETYPNISEKLKPMNEWVKKAKKEIKNRKVQKLREEKEKEEKEVQLEKERENREEKLREGRFSRMCLTEQAHRARRRHPMCPREHGTNN